MTEKRFKLHITWLNNDYEEGEAELKDGSQPLALFDSVEDARIVRDLLNELNDEVVKGDLFKLTVAMAIQHRINWLKKQIWDNTDRIDELQSLKKELKL